MQVPTLLSLIVLAVAVPQPLTGSQPATQPVQDPLPVADPPPDQLDFSYLDTRMTVPVTIGATGPHRFIVDTGAERTVISRELAGLLGLARGRNVRLTAMSGVANVGTAVIPSISVGPLGGKRIEAPTLEAVNLGAPGMLGIDSLQGHALSIDFDRSVMAVSPSVRRRVAIPAQPGEIVVSARSLLGQLVVTDAHYGTRRVRVVLDTGSAVTMGNPALRKLVRERNIKPISLRSVIGGEVLADYTQIGEVRVGKVMFSNLPVAFADAAPFRRLGLTDRPALLLGMDALRLFRRVSIDFPNREVRFALPRDVRTRL